MNKGPYLSIFPAQTNCVKPVQPGRARSNNSGQSARLRHYYVNTQKQAYFSLGAKSRSLWLSNIIYILKTYRNQLFNFI